MEKSKKVEDLSFEEAMSELDVVVKNMETNQVPLDQMMKFFERGKALSNYCNAKLTEYEKKIEILVKADSNKENDQFQDFSDVPF